MSSLPTGREEPPLSLFNYGRDTLAIMIHLISGESQLVKGFDLDYIPLGVKVRVVDDPGDIGDGRRPVTVRVVEGTHEGQVGTVRRRDLRPAPH
jgi:hypothetical protein